MRVYQGKLLIDEMEFWGDIIKKYFPDNGDELRFGPIHHDAETGEIVIPYIGSSSCDPDKLVDEEKPDWMKTKGGENEQS